MLHKYNMHSALCFICPSGPQSKVMNFQCRKKRRRTIVLQLLGSGLRSNEFSQVRFSAVLRRSITLSSDCFVNAKTGPLSPRAESFCSDHNIKHGTKLFPTFIKTANFAPADSGGRTNNFLIPIPIYQLGTRTTFF